MNNLDSYMMKYRKLLLEVVLHLFLKKFVRRKKRPLELIPKTLTFKP